LPKQIRPGHSSFEIKVRFKLAGRRRVASEGQASARLFGPGNPKPWHVASTR
jgi:hypothetical protein